MNVNNAIINVLYKLLRAEALTGQETALLAEWSAESEHNRQILQDVNNGYLLQEDLQQRYALDKKAAWEKVSDKLFKEAKPKRLWLPWAAAASVILAAGTFYFYPDKTTTPAKLAPVAKSWHPPAGNRAMLTLADGTQIPLDSAGNGTLASQGNVKIIKLNNGQLAYRGSSTPGSAVQYNTLTTPRGGQYQIVLPDGTKVWLNSASSLIYPTTGKERTVRLSGQAYFEVAANAAAPFKVKVNEMEIVVMGTAFDVMAYSDEKTINTTLVSGAVKVMDKVLKPGQQAVLNNHELSVQETDVDRVIAWKNGRFIFNDTDLPTILREVSRWYDVEIVYKTIPGNEKYGGGISRRIDLSNVLQALEANGKNHFSIANKQVTVLP
jgi:ferric-dicitrate binding protein FerR (iron transport regulator)